MLALDVLWVRANMGSMDKDADKKLGFNDLPTREEWLNNAPEKTRKAYDRYMKEHQKKLRQLQREANGEQVPGDYDGGYDE